MGRRRPHNRVWAECLRVLKPGGHLLAFAGTRTQNRIAVRIEDAGFEIRDMIAWVYGSGFPKSNNGPWGGTALKPALEPITVAHKPLEGTVTANHAEHGLGGLNVQMCRIPSVDQPRNSGRGGKESAGRPNQSAGSTSFAATPGPRGGDPLGRLPANFIHDGSNEVLAHFPVTTSGAMKSGIQRAAQEALGSVCYGTYGGNFTDGDIEASTGSPARFFYWPRQAGRTERRACQAEAHRRCPPGRPCAMLKKPNGLRGMATITRQ